MRSSYDANALISRGTGIVIVSRPMRCVGAVGDAGVVAGKLRRGGQKACTCPTPYLGQTIVPIPDGILMHGRIR